jgi:putative protein-disulfide isomerase
MTKEHPMANPPLLDLGLAPRTQLDLEFVYVGDPMCSWCWGFSPALEKLESRYRIPLRVVMGGLRTGSQAEPMDAEARDQLTDYWQGVAQRTGQPFTNASLERDGWRYDTEPSCRAVVAMRELARHETLRWVARLHRAFYVEGVDITDMSVIPGLLDGFDVDPDHFAQLLADDATIERTQQDFAEAQGYGVAGFPTVLFRDSEELAIVTRGFVPWDQLEPALTDWLEKRYGDLTTDLFCDPETGIC